LQHRSLVANPEIQCGAGESRHPLGVVGEIPGEPPLVDLQDGRDDPDAPEDWEYIGKYSPYQNARTDRAYPPILLTTSTRDDRVHPGHARKMAALLEEQGHEFWYHENIEGGHGGAADNKQSAFQAALIYEFFTQMLIERRA
uniref:prolyl oligopeptidase family serine peptidase n=1 Tax=Nocardia abscessus TaxID=120957 RepID=UPI0024559AF8